MAQVVNIKVSPDDNFYCPKYGTAIFDQENGSFELTGTAFMAYLPEGILEIEDEEQRELIENAMDENEDIEPIEVFEKVFESEDNIVFVHIDSSEGPHLESSIVGLNFSK